jgi:hypothetical protein
VIYDDGGLNGTSVVDMIIMICSSTIDEHNIKPSMEEMEHKQGHEYDRKVQREARMDEWMDDWWLCMEMIMKY